jgi:hypothetical protein
VVQQTLDNCTSENVAQLEEAMDAIYRQYSQGYQHDYRQLYQIQDIDINGMPCSPRLNTSHSDMSCVPNHFI